MHNFDPYEELLKAQHRIAGIEGSIQQIAMAFNERATLMDQLVKNQEQLIKQLNLQDLQINKMHDRIRLLEAVRQHENKN
jgi:hypothetical protein